MVLKELSSSDQLTTLITTSPNALVCFSATWCGPCTASKPDLMSMADAYHRDPSIDLTVAIIYENVLGEDIHSYRVQAFPTYILFVKGKEAGRVAGVNFDAIKKLIDVQGGGCKSDMGVGHGLGGGATVSMEEAKRLRLERFEKASAAPPAAAPAVEEKMDTSDDVKMEDVDTSSATAPVCPPATSDDPCANLDKEALEQLTSIMGFSLLRSQKGLLYGDGTVETAVEWLLAHQDDADIDDPIPPTPPKTDQVAQSYKCNDCGKILSNMANLELHANKTGHSDFEESTEAVKPLTPEEKAAKVEQIKDLLKKKRAEREKAEKEQDIIREKARRTMGQEMSKTREMMEVEKRKRDAYLKRKEKEEFKRERERIKRELAKDKATRQANKGKLNSKLGVDGYNPDAIQYDVDDGEGGGPAAVPQAPKKKVADPKKIDDYISKVSQYRAGGDGGKCLKILLAYVKNVADSDEDKFKTINMENKAFKSKVKPFVGGKHLLLAVGFNPNEEGTALVLGEDADKEVLKSTKKKLEEALAKYNA